MKRLKDKPRAKGPKVAKKAPFMGGRDIPKFKPDFKTKRKGA